MTTPTNNTNSATNQQQIDHYLQTQSDLSVLRFITCGSVDDGKSTLIGRLLYESQTLFDDQVESLKSDSKKSGTQGDNIDFALLVDGLSAEREQGITIDVAYRFFATDQRKFIVADTPGHEQYTRNMVTGASTADAAVLLVDARHGIQTQTKRHAFITSLLGVQNIILAINKMDLVDYSQTVYDRIVEDFGDFATSLSLNNVTAIPLSALNGDNILNRSSNMTWYAGSTLLGYLETAPINDSQTTNFRFPVQWVNRPSADFRGFSGTVYNGQINQGDAVRVLPSGKTSTVKDIVLYKDQLNQASQGQSVTLTLTDEIDISRGDVMTTADSPCEVADQFQVNIVWLADDPCYIGRTYQLKIHNVKVNAMVSDLKFKYNVNTLEHLAADSLTLNDIAVATLSLDKPIPFDPYRVNKLMGAFILIDKYNHQTVGSGMIDYALRRATNIHHHAHAVDRSAREKLSGNAAHCYWFTGLSGSGKSTIADAFEKALHSKGIRTYILDGDNIRHGLNQDLGFTDADRVENIRRVTEVAKLMVDAGVVVICSFISPFRAERQLARSTIGDADFTEVFVSTSLAVAEQRDPKGLYKKARSGEIPNFTGIGSPYEAPENPEIRIDAGEVDVDSAVEQLLTYHHAENK